jgi:predicted HAD superfamily Cof-like phosphohydrolase
MVREFHKAFGVPAPLRPTLLLPQRQMLRERLIREEFGEYQRAADAGDLVAIADALADLAYVVRGAAVEHGLVRFDEIFAEVHRANMSKLREDGKPVVRHDGKILKSGLYTPPDIAPLLKAAP